MTTHCLNKCINFKCNNYDFENSLVNSQKTISIPYILYESIKGNYFIGETGVLNASSNGTKMVAIANPNDSNIILHVNVITISNFGTSKNIIANIYLGSDFPKTSGITISQLVSPSNIAIYPEPCPKGQIQFTSVSLNEKPLYGSQIFTRIAPPSSTLVDENDGKLILAPGQKLIVYFNAPLLEDVAVAFGWFEEPIHYFDC